MGTPAPASRAMIVTALLVLYLLWGATYLGMRWAVEGIPPFLMTSARFFLAGAFMYAVLRIGGASRPTGVDWFRSGIISLCLMVGGNGGVAYSEQYISSGLAALLLSTVPLWIIVLAWLGGTGPRPTSWILAGLVIGFFGMFLLVKPGLHFAGDFSPRGFKGIAAALIAALVWSIGSLYARRVHLSISPILAVAMQMLQASVVLLMMACLTQETAAFDYHRLTGRAMGAFVFLVVAGPIGFTAYVWLIRVCAPSLVTTYAFVNPVIAMGLGWALAGESITGSMLMGAACLVAGVAMVVMGQPAAAPAKELTEKESPL